MGNGFWSPSERKKKSALGKINGLSQVTPATIAYAVAQVCLYSTFAQLLKGFRRVLLFLPARNGESKTANLSFKTFIMQSWSFSKTKKTSGWWRLWHGGTSKFIVSLVSYTGMTIILLSDKFFLTNSVRKTNKWITAMSNRTQTVFDQRPNALG